MRENTRTSLLVIDGPAIAVDPDLANKPNIGPSSENISVCARCSETIFSPITWAHLRGDTLDQPIPNIDSDISDYHIRNDCDFVVRMFNAGENPKHRGPMVDFKIPIKDILESSQTSCGFCKLLVELDIHGTLLAEHDKTRVLRLQAFWPEMVNGSMHPMMLEVGLHPDIYGGGQTWPLTFFNERAIPHSSENADPLTIEEIWTLLLQQAATWLWNCERTHNECSYIENQRPPTRLLDLIHLRDQERVHLVESADVANGQYAVLSYVSGTSNTVHLDEATQSKFKGGFALEELPRTIREAMLVTEALHIRHLWIDSLCILQDSDTDKSHEIPFMNKYYQNALVVISASGAKDVHSGFLFYQDTSPDIYAKLQDPEPIRQCITGSVPLRVPGHFPDYSTSLLVNTLPIMYEYKREPINNRAWTLQESVLPRRLLTFPMTGGLSMRCLAGEVLAGEIVSDPYHEIPDFTSLGIVSLSGRTGDELHELWTKLVKDYTQRSLSYRSDILVAIGALAREFHTKNGALLGKYLGGLWENHVRSGLLWHNTQLNLVPQPEQQTQYFAPSWSWASCPWPIVFRNKPEMRLPIGTSINSPETLSMYTPRWYCEVLSFEVTSQSELDPFRALKAGFLTIQGPLRPLQRQTDNPSDRNQTKSKSHGCPHLYLREAWGAAEALILDRPLISSGCTGSEDQQYCWFGLWYAGRGRARGLIVHQINETSFQRLGYAEYVVDEAEFPSSEMHKERVIRLI